MISKYEALCYETCYWNSFACLSQCGNGDTVGMGTDIVGTEIRVAGIWGEILRGRFGMGTSYWPRIQLSTIFLMEDY